MSWVVGEREACVACIHMYVQTQQYVGRECCGRWPSEEGFRFFSAELDHEIANTVASEQTLGGTTLTANQDDQRHCVGARTTMEAVAITEADGAERVVMQQMQPMQQVQTKWVDELKLSADELGKLSLRAYRHTRTRRIPESVLTTFVELINASFSGEQHTHNFGDKPRYASTEELLRDLDRDRGAWVLMLFTGDKAEAEIETALGPGPERKEVAVAGAKLTLSGEGMDGGEGYTLVNPSYRAREHAEQLPTFWLGALGSIAPGAGATLISHIKTFLSTLTSQKPYRLRAYTVAQWGQSDPRYTIPPHSSLLSWFQSQHFEVLNYSWKPPGTWGSFYGACLCAIEYVHATDDDRST